MNLLHHDYVTDIIVDNHFTFLVIEKELFYMQFFRDLKLALENEDSKLACLDRGEVKNLSKIGDWAEQSWTLDFSQKKLKTKAYSEVQRYLDGSDKERELIKKWYELQDYIQEVLSENSRLILSDNFVNLEDLLKAFGARLSELPNNSYIERLEEYILYQVEYGGKQIFIFDQVLAYLSKDELEELIAFSEREDIYVLAVEACESDKIKDSKGRYLLIDQDGCELLIRPS